MWLSAVLFGDCDPACKAADWCQPPREASCLCSDVREQDSAGGSTDDRTLLTLLNLRTAAPKRLTEPSSYRRDFGPRSSCFGSFFWAGHGRTVWSRAITECAAGTVCWKDGAQRGERFSVFLENVRQEMPKAHLELLHIQEVYAWQPRPSARRLPT